MFTNQFINFPAILAQVPEAVALIKGSNSFFGYHIHIGESCSGNEADSFADALTHYNPTNSSHPAHEGDLPPLFGNKGYAISVLLTDRYSLEDIMEKTIIVHSAPDDFTTQPSGNSGEKIACGEIKAL